MFTQQLLKLNSESLLKSDVFVCGGVVTAIRLLCEWLMTPKQSDKMRQTADSLKTIEYV